MFQKIILLTLKGSKRVDDDECETDDGNDECDFIFIPIRIYKWKQVRVIRSDTVRDTVGKECDTDGNECDSV